MLLPADALAADQALSKAAPVGLTIRLQLLDAGVGADGLAGHAVYLWHGGRDGLYSLYSNGFGAPGYLRGLQRTDGTGAVTFHGQFPACHAGHAPQVHLEVHPPPSRGGSPAHRIHTIALSFAPAILREVYGRPGYAQSARHLAQMPAAAAGLPVAPVSGNATDGYELVLRLPVAG